MLKNTAGVNKARNKAIESIMQLALSRFDESSTTFYRLQHERFAHAYFLIYQEKIHGEFYTLESFCFNETHNLYIVLFHSDRRNTSHSKLSAISRNENREN